MSDPRSPRRYVQLSIPARLENVAMVGVAIRGIGRLLGLNEVEANRLELCAVEAVTNVIRHGSPGDADQAITASLDAWPGRLELVVTGRGAVSGGLDLETGPEVGSLTEERGRGLALIRAIMDRVEFRVEGDRQILSMGKDLKDPA